MDILYKLSDTPVPNVLVIAGIVFLLLAVAGKVGANLSVPPNRQKTAALIGTILLISGIALFMVPSGSKSRGVEQQNTVEKLPPKPLIPLQDSIKQAIKDASQQEVIAKRYLDPTNLKKYYKGEALRSVLATIHSLKQFEEFQECKISGRQYHNKINIYKGGREAVIDMTEDWNCASYSVKNGNCLGQYASTINIRQTVVMKLRASGWMVNTIKLAEANKGAKFVKCTNIWPANIKF